MDRGIGRQLVASAAIFPNDGVRTGNFVCMELRLYPHHLNRPVCVEALADSGSDYLTLFPNDILALGLTSAYIGIMAPVRLTTANGTVSRSALILEARIWNSNWTQAIGGWFLENAVLCPLITRFWLSGGGLPGVYPTVPTIPCSGVT
ncbi:uncharacterized protein DFL_000729 [Arthrobotrys flagrans]|uniref:Peptidase A2 domain-containing protein n=1 Tax=Arthrobotrys flagrans TaxID=97331 RepID=A0A437AF78_ARTFL|nr:hypothetical protein DFL_000729 [Arthrobotrys flagrans]